ncbi:MBL fold metallo-hydrolase [Streptomyces anulatus]|uniref:MBL fold metallo-hydrolase n=1 Tax=Streptomyces anulatus TaxID=1892 RepID=UPI003722AA6F
MAYIPKRATPATAAANSAAVARYDMDDRQDFADADRGFIAPFPDKLHGADGRVIFDASNFDYIADDAVPDTVHPSLWRQSQVIRKGGLYKVVDGIYQVRSNDIANLTVVEGETGLVIVDCMASVEAASQGMTMIREHVSDKPVAAVIYTHTHTSTTTAASRGSSVPRRWPRARCRSSRRARSPPSTSTRSART